MRHFATILSHEIRMLLVNPSTYIAAVVFLSIMGMIFTRILESYTESPQEASPAGVFFLLFYIPVLFMVPLLTMKSISEERRQGTLETLLTTPVSTAEVVLGKFFASYFLYIALWALTGGFFWILRKYAQDPRLLDPGPLVGGYLYIAISGLLFVGVGILASSLARSQAVAGIVAGAVLFILILGPEFLEGRQFMNNEGFQVVKAAIDYAQIFRHLQDFSQGILDVREVLFYVSGAALTLIFSVLGVEAKLLHS